MHDPDQLLHLYATLDRNGTFVGVKTARATRELCRLPTKGMINLRLTEKPMPLDQLRPLKLALSKECRDLQCVPRYLQIGEDGSFAVVKQHRVQAAPPPVIVKQTRSPEAIAKQKARLAEKRALRALTAQVTS